jgi:signal transduction histidine kinase
VAENGVDTPAVASAISGKTGTTVQNGYRGARVLSAFAPLAVGPATWAIVAEVEEDEIDRGIDSALTSSFVLMMGISTVSVILLAMLMGGLILRHVRATADVFGRLTEDVLAGNLSIQGDPAAVGPDFRPLMKGTNDLVRAFASRIDDLPVPVVMVDADRVVRFANTAAARLCGKDRDSMIGSSCCETCRCGLAGDGGAAASGGLCPADRSLCPAAESLCPAATAISESRVVSGETTLATACGAVPVRFTSSPVTHPDGHVLGAWQVMVDLTEPRRMETEKRRLENQLYRSQRLEALGTLASGIAHDFNNILSYMLVYADLAATDLAATDPDADSRARQNLDEISRAIDRAAGIVRQMLVFSRQMDGRRVVFAAAPVVADTVKLVTAGMPPDIRVVFRGDGLETMVEGDPTHLSQIVMNLCSNSRDALEGRRGTIAVDLRETREASATGGEPLRMLRIAVSDDGCGMDARTVEHLFEPFFTTKAPGKGTGLGMSVVHGIVTTWGGAVHVDSVPGRGTSIEILLPCA